MKLSGYSLLHNYIRQYPKTKSWIDNWIADTRAAAWATPHEIRARYATCSFLAENIVIFNVCGNNHRLEVVVAYQNQLVIARWIGTHAEYTRRLRN